MCIHTHTHTHLTHTSEPHFGSVPEPLSAVLQDLTDCIGTIWSYLHPFLACPIWRCPGTTFVCEVLSTSDLSMWGVRRACLNLEDIIQAPAPGLHGRALWSSPCAPAELFICPWDTFHADAVSAELSNSLHEISELCMIVESVSKE